MNKYMKVALEEAKLAYDKGDVPVGAVIVLNDEVIAKAHNRKEEKQVVTAHAEILAIEEASKKLNSWHLDDCQMYVTVEPCAMCSGAIVNSRIKKVYYGAPGKKFGAHKSIVNVLENNDFNHFVEVEAGMEEKEATELMQKFFKSLRK